MNPVGIMPAVLLALMLLLGLTHYSLADAPAEHVPPASCSVVRAAIEQFGEALVLSQARARGYSEDQIERIRRACIAEKQNGRQKSNRS